MAAEDTPAAGGQPGRPAPAAGGRADLPARAAELEAELARLRASAVAGAKVMLRVAGEHSEFTFGGVTVTAGPTPVPENLAAALLEAAAQAGVKLLMEAI